MRAKELQPTEAGWSQVVRDLGLIGLQLDLLVKHIMKEMFSKTKSCFYGDVSSARTDPSPPGASPTFQIQISSHYTRG